MKSRISYFHFVSSCHYSKTCVKRPLKKDKKIFMTNGSLMKDETIAECSPWSILQFYTFDLHLAIISLEKHFFFF